MRKPSSQSSPPKRLRKISKNILLVALVTALCILLLEVGIRVAYRIRNARVQYVMLPYMVRNFGAVPPWNDGLRILDPDDELMHRGRPHTRRTYMDLFCPMPSDEDRKALLGRFNPEIPDQFKNSPVWTISLNADGFRDEEFPATKPANTIRIIALGDSWTFGHNVESDQTYPNQLRALLRQDFGDRNVEVLNLGMLAYTSHEGLKLLRQKVLGLQPDIVLIGYSMNDASISGWHDKDIFVPKQKRFNLRRFITENSELCKLAMYLGQLKKFESVTMGETIKAVSDPNDKFVYESWVSAEALEAADYQKLEARIRVPPADYEQNLREMIRLIKEHGAVPILLHNELRPGSPYQSALEKISREEMVALVDSCELIGYERRLNEALLEQKLGLTWTPVPAIPGGETEVVFRLQMDRAEVPKAPAIVGPYPQLGDDIPNKVLMYDDGTHGDQKAGDGVWSFTATFSPGRKIFYTYTNSGTEGKWENLDLPKVRSFVVPSSIRTSYRPIETFGKLYLQADGFHTNSQGYQIIARAVHDELIKTEKFQALLKR